MLQPGEKRQRCSYHDALAAIGLMKGVPMIDVARDDALISALMELDLSCVRLIVELYDRDALGYPTPEKIAALAASCGPGAESQMRAPEPEPQFCIPVHTVGSRLIGMVWGVITGIATAVAVGWMTAAPWLQQVAAWLLALPVKLGTRVFGPGSIAFLAGFWT